MIGAIIHVRVPGITLEPVWCLQVDAQHIVALERHIDHKAGMRWSHTADRELPPQPDEPPDHILVAAMRLTLEGKLKCED